MAAFGQTVRRWFNVSSAPDSKSSATSRLPHSGSQVTWLQQGKPNWTARGYSALVREGYLKNSVAHRAVKMVSECAASLPLQVLRDTVDVSKSPAGRLLARPNPAQDTVSFFETLYTHMQLAGNAYVEMVLGADGVPAELYLLRPDRMSVVPGSNGWPLAYEYKVAGRTHRFPVDSVTGRSNILHLKSFHPLDDHYGMSSLEAAAQSIDIFNATADWNKALLDNAARPSGALVFEPSDGQSGTLSDEQVTRLKAEMAEQFQGSENAGRPFLLEGGLKWQSVGFSPMDMDFINSKAVSAREIALAFGVPPMLLGLPGDNTYSNYQEANRALWRTSILPLVTKVMAGVDGWLMPRFGDGFTVSADTHNIPALAVEREKLWSRLNSAKFMTLNEKRLAVGLPPIKGGDVLSAKSEVAS